MPHKIKQINQINPKLQMQIATSFSFMQNLQHVQKKKKKNCSIQEERKINPNAKLNIKIIKKKKKTKSGGF